MNRAFMEAVDLLEDYNICVSYQEFLEASWRTIAMNIKEYKKYKNQEIEHLYTSVGWTAYTEDLTALKEGFANSLCVFGAYENEKLVGIIRVVGDGATIVLVQDILVLPEYQRKGVGSALLRTIMERYKNVRQLQLVTDDTEKTIAFYQSMGFESFSEIGCCGFMRS